MMSWLICCKKKFRDQSVTSDGVGHGVWVVIGPASRCGEALMREMYEIEDNC